VIIEGLVERIPELKALALLILLVVSIASFQSVSVAQATSGPQIPTEGGTWTSSTIKILITPQTGASWFKDSYTYDVNHAIGRWVQSIKLYTDNYGSDYLRSLNFVTCVAGVNDTLCGSPDIQVRFIDTFGPQSNGGLGITSIKTTNFYTFVAPTVTTLAAYDPDNVTQLTDTDMINIASHEFGHGLGLGHATVSVADDGTFELMFLSYGQAVGNSRNSLEAPSTLDIYALSYLYDWLASSSTLNGQGHPTTQLSLPSGVAYTSVYPFGEQVQIFQNGINQLKLELIIVAAVAAFLLVLVFVLGILLARKKPAPPPAYVWGPVPTTPTV
jgi:hypothetical protein